MTDAIWESTRNAVRIAQEAEALIGAYDQMIQSHPFGPFEIDIDDWSDETLRDEHDWISFYYLVNFRVLERTPRLASRGRLALAMSLHRLEDEAGDNWPNAKRAKLYVGFAPTSKAWDADSLYVNGSGSAGNGERLSEFRWGVRDKAGGIMSWFFAVALEGIESREDFVREVLSPITLLLNGGADEDAFAHSQSLLRTG